MTLTLTRRRAVLVLLAVLAFTVAYVAGAARSSGSPASFSAADRLTPQPGGTATGTGITGISVGGTAKVSGTPDTLRLDLSVVAKASSVSEALASANRTAGAVQKSLLGSGVQKEDLQTAGLSIQPNYDYSSAGTPRLRGYQVSESVNAKLRSLGRAGEAIGKAVQAGGDAVRVNGISLDLEDTGLLVSRARDQAFADARAKAEQYAKAAGRSLGEVVSIAEDVSSAPPIAMPTSAGLYSEKSSAVPIQPGSQDVAVSVSVVFSMR